MITALLLIFLGLVLMALIIAANGYFVAQEFTYMSVDRLTLRARAAEGDPAAARALRVTDRTSFMLSGAQLGITVTGLLVGYVAEPFIGEPVGVLLGGIEIPSAVGILIGTTLALFLAAIVQMIFGELFPKNLAIANPTPLSLALSRSTIIYLAVFGPLITFFDRSSNALLRLVRVEPVHDIDSSATAEDLEYLVDASRTSGDLPADLSHLIGRVLEFPGRDVEHAMISRSVVDSLTDAVTIAEARALMAGAHTRYPVLDKRGTPIGVLHLGDVLACPADDQRSISSVMRDPLVFSALMPLPDALDSLLKTNNELACVVDEYGGFVGILTLEDLAEEFVGELSDEHDPVAGPPIVPNGDGSWRVEGNVPLDELERELDYDLPRGDFETLAGLVIAEHGGLPPQGITVDIPLAATADDLIANAAITRVLSVEITEVDRFVPSILTLRINTSSASGNEREVNR